LSASFGGDSWSWIANVMTGPEVSETAAGDPDDEYLTIWDTTLSVDVSPRLSVMGNFDYGTWKFAGEDVKWYGLAAYAKFQANEKWGVVARYEWINDEDGGFMTIGQKAQSFTLTSDHDVLDGLKMRFEYRLDKTDAAYFEKSEGSLTDSQSTLTVGLVYGFNGKI
jgi:hypothetical protein